MRDISFTVADDHVPALLAAVEEMGDNLATRAQDKDSYPREAALTRAIVALAPLRTALYAAVRAVASMKRKRGMPEARIADGADPDFPLAK